jgi:hypothetical protein
MRRREFLGAGLALNLGSAVTLVQQGASGDDPGRGAVAASLTGVQSRGAVPNLRAKTTRMFESPELYPTRWP